ncbi:MAG TPA: hypothetical protein VKQ36_09935 [Ktedonobacterales bacterium]|nr:hypothetical protein [Ktedonobacterales bacterium]
MRVFSFGGGVQSTAALVLAAQGRIDYRTFLFANVGADSENPATLAYVRDVALPYAQAHGLELIELTPTTKGRPETLLQRLHRTERSFTIPVRGPNGMPVAQRKCTTDFKIRTIAQWLRKHGATRKNPATVALGISLDEYQRMRQNTDPNQMTAYPLIDLRITRQECHRIIQSADLPTPPKSSCTFCPYHPLAAWREMANHRPDEFAQAVEVERLLHERSKTLKRKPVYLTRYGKPLPMVVAPNATLWDDVEDSCESGYCMV